MRAHQNHRERSAPHDHAQRLHSVHAWHFQVEGNHIRAQLFDLLQREGPVHGGSDHFDLRIAHQDTGDQLPHQRGIVHHQDSDAVLHAMAPSGVARERRERTAGTFKIRTTVPSPRIEAPLTRSLATMSAGRALMTSSSSPTSWSTMRPKRFSAAPMTMMKFFLASLAELTA